MKHLLSGISRMISFMVVGAIFAGLAGRLAPDSPLSPLLQALGPDGGLALMLPVLAGFIAHSIAGWNGLVPGMIGGLIAYRSGSGMLGGVLTGYIAGYAALWVDRCVPLPAVVADLKHLVVVPFLSALVLGVVMLYIVNPPATFVMKGMQSWLIGMQGQSGFLMGAILGGMSAVDMGGPINKAAALFTIDLLAAGVAEPLGAAVGGVIIPAMGIALAMRISPRRFTAEELKLGRTAFYLGLMNIVEGTIPIAMGDPKRIIPAITLGGAVSGGICMALGVGVRLPIGGFLTPLIPGMVTNISGYLLAIAVGTAVTAGIITVLKPVRAA